MIIQWLYNNDKWINDNTMIIKWQYDNDIMIEYNDIM